MLCVAASQPRVAQSVQEKRTPLINPKLPSVNVVLEVVVAQRRVEVLHIPRQVVKVIRVLEQLVRVEIRRQIPIIYQRVHLLNERSEC